MALIRCSVCGVKPPGRSGYKRAYVRNAQPLGHPKSALVCGSPSCSGAGLIWLEQSHFPWVEGELPKPKSKKVEIIEI